MTRLLIVLMCAAALGPAGRRAALAETAAPAAAKKPAGKAKSKPAARPTSTRPGRRDRAGQGGREMTASSATDVHAINENVEVTPFPSHAAAARKALSQNRRDQLDDAERAARAAHQDDRWQTVLFELRELDARSDAEACFWRVLSYYRLGQMARARSVRQLCTLGAKEESLLDTEDATCAGLQPAVLPEMAAAGERAPGPVVNPAPYGGASPAHLER